MENQKLNTLIGETLSEFAVKSTDIDNDVNSNMMLVALTILGMLKENEPTVYECAMVQLGERLQS